MKIQSLRNFVITIFSAIFMLAGNGISQMPTPSPVQTPNLPGGTYIPSWITRDDFEVFPNRGPEPYYWITSNDNTSGRIAIYSQSYSFGTMFPSSCFFGFCQQGSVLGYTNQLPDGTVSTGYGADVGYYYTEYIGQYSNLAKVTMIATAPDDDENAGESCPAVGQPVNVTNGNMWLRQTDFVLPGLGQHIEINRFYNSIIQRSGIFGRGWSTAYDESLQIYGNLARLNMPDGRAVYFVRETPTSPFMPHTAGTYAFIEQNADGSYTLTFKDGMKHQFNSGGFLLSIKDRNANQTTLNYDTNNNLIGITDASGRTLTINMSGGLVQSISDSLGIIASYAYYPNTSNLQTVTYQDGSQYKFEYDTTTVAGKTFLKTVKDANDKILETHEYDSQGRATTSEKEGGVEKYIFDYSNWGLTAPNYPYTLVKHKKNASDPNYIETKYFFDKTKTRNFVWKTEGNCNCGGGAEVTTYEYDDRLNLKKKSEQVSTNVWRETTYTYNYQGDLLTTTDPWGTVMNTYNAYGQVLTTADRMNGIWTNTYDANGNLTTVKDPLDKTTTFNYPATNNKGLPDSMTDARQNTTKYKWYASGLLQETEDPYLKKTAYTYDARSRIKSVTNALSHITQYNYFDDTQRKIEVIYPDLNTTVYEFDNRRLLSKITDERLKITTYQFDDTYRLIRVTDPLGHAKEYGYDLMSNMTSAKDALGNSTDYKYDDFDRLQEIEYPAATIGATRLKENYTYDDLGRVKTFSDTAGRLTTYNYFDNLRKNEIINAANEKTTVEYNNRFQRTKVKDALNQEYVFTYDALGRQLSQTRAGSTMSYEYDGVGNRTKRTDYTGRETNYTYDVLNRLTDIDYVNEQTLNASYIYDDLSRLTIAENKVGTVSFTYDNRNRMKTTTDVFGHLIEYDYDAASNRMQLKLDGTVHTTYAYDAANRLTTLTDEASQNFTFGYDIANRLISKTLPNAITTTYNYDGMSRLTRLKHQSQTATLTDNNFTYNAANQINQIAELTQTKNFAYDNIDRLTSMTSGTANENYAFDGVGNRTTSQRSPTYAYQPFNKLTATQNSTYAYDANGNMTSRTGEAGKFTFTWDYENRLVGARSGRFNWAEYKYDALGRRVRRTLPVITTEFTYDGMDVVMDSENGVITKYQNGLGIDDKLKMVKNGQAKYFLQDHLGSTVGLADSSGAFVSSASYDSFGNSTNNLTTRYQYTGREYDSFTGLYYYRARWYDANLGRFISEDPIGFAGGDVNLYGYVRNNPQMFRDPSGKFVVPLIIGGIVIGGLILASPENINAPGPGDPVYRPDNPLILNAAGGSACSYLFGRFASPLIGRFLSGTGDDIIELGISQSPSRMLTPPAPPSQIPSFLGQENGPAIPIPQGSAKTPIINPGGNTTGFGYTGGTGGGNGLNPRVNSVRIMDATLPKGLSPGYPNGYVNYMNQSGQAINPYTGQTIPKNSPWWHIPLD